MFRVIECQVLLTLDHFGRTIVELYGRQKEYIGQDQTDVRAQCNFRDRIKSTFLPCPVSILSRFGSHDEDAQPLLKMLSTQQMLLIECTSVIFETRNMVLLVGNDIRGSATNSCCRDGRVETVWKDEHGAA